MTALVLSSITSIQEETVSSKPRSKTRLLASPILFARDVNKVLKNEN
jgi:hypothetical protein